MRPSRLANATRWDMAWVTSGGVGFSLVLAGTLWTTSPHIGRASSHVISPDPGQAGEAQARTGKDRQSGGWQRPGVLHMALSPLGCEMQHFVFPGVVMLHLYIDCPTCLPTLLYTPYRNPHMVLPYCDSMQSSDIAETGWIQVCPTGYLSTTL